MVKPSLKSFSVLCKLGILKNSNNLFFSKHSFFKGKSQFLASYLYIFYLFRIGLIRIKKGVLKSTPSRYLGTTNTEVTLTITTLES